MLRMWSLFGIVLKVCAEVAGSQTWCRHIHPKTRSGSWSYSVSLPESHRKATLHEPQAVVWHVIAQDEAGHMNMLLSVSLRVAQNAEIIPT